MIEKLLEAFFRHAIIIILPIVVIPLDAMAAVLSTPPQYEATAGIWVERATYLTYSTDELNRYLTPAQNQRNRLIELLQTRTFVSGVVSRTPLAAILARPDGDQEVEQVFRRDFEIAAVGEHLLVARFRAEDRDTTGQVLTAILQSFKTRSVADRYGQAQLAISVLQTRVNDAETKLSAARDALAKYIANPAISASFAKSGIDSLRLDPQFAETQRSVDSSLRDADSARDLLQRARLDVSAGTEGDELGFRITDATQVSLSPSRQLKKVLIYPIGGLLAGLLLSVALLLLFALSDHSVRSLADLAPDTVILGVLPHLRGEGVGRRSGSAATRRAIGHAAGSALEVRTEKGRKAS